MDNKYNRHKLYKSILKVKINNQRFTRLHPPPKGNGFPPIAKERI